MSDLEKEPAVLMISELNLENIQLDALTADTPLYGEGFGSGSIDILEVVLLISKKYGSEPRSGDPGNQKIFILLSSLAAYVAEYHTRQTRASAWHIPLPIFSRTDVMPITGASTSHFVLILSCNPDHEADDAVCNTRVQWNPIWVMVNGSTDGSTECLQAMAVQDPRLRMIILSRNRGRGVAVLAGLEAVTVTGFIYILTMDADRQHSASLIPEFTTASQTTPDAIILGQPVFDATASQMCAQSRCLPNGCADIETL